MIYSMTGFGRAETIDAKRKITVEIKSVNHRYLDFNIKMPKKFGFFENSIRTILKEYIKRGKIDVFITYEDFAVNKPSLVYNKSLALEYVKAASQMEEDFGIKNDLSVGELITLPEVLSMEESADDEEQVFEAIERTIKEAVSGFLESRKAEGKKLSTDIQSKLDYMSHELSLIEERGPVILSEYTKKLETKAKELLSGAQLEDSRIAAEVVLFADKICTDEEVVRLKSHIDGTKELFLHPSKDGIGRKLDFIAQEMNREANTILSKANDLEISNIAIILKTEIEKVREQIQNIE